MSLKLYRMEEDIISEEEIKEITGCLEEWSEDGRSFLYRDTYPDEDPVDFPGTLSSEELDLIRTVDAEVYFYRKTQDKVFSMVTEEEEWLIYGPEEVIKESIPVGIPYERVELEAFEDID